MGGDCHGGLLLVVVVGDRRSAPSLSRRHGRAACRAAIRRRLWAARSRISLRYAASVIASRLTCAVGEQVAPVRRIAAGRAKLAAAQAASRGVSSTGHGGWD